MCSTWLNFRIKTLHFRIKYNLITVINKEEEQHHQKEKNVDEPFLNQKKKKQKNKNLSLLP